LADNINYNGQGGMGSLKGNVFADGMQIDERDLNKNQSASQQQQSDVPVSQQMAMTSAKALNTAADFSDGRFELPGGQRVDGGLKEAAGQFVAEGTYRQQNDVHDGILKMEKTAALLTLASGNYVRSQNAAAYDKFVENGGAEFLVSNNILNRDVVGSFEQATKIQGLNEAQIKSVANFGFYETTPIHFDEKECGVLNQFLNTQSTEDKKAVLMLFGQKGVTCKSDNTLDVMTLSRDITSSGLLSGTYSEKVKLGSSEMEAAKSAVREKELFDSIMSGGKKKVKADDMEFIRLKTVRSIGIEDFTGSKSQMKELKKLHKVPVRDTHGDIVYEADGKTKKMKDVRRFTDKKGHAIEVDEEKYNEICEKIGVVGETTAHQRSEQIRKGQMNRVGTAVLNDDAKTGLAFSKNTVKVTAKTAATAYRATLTGIDNIKIAAHAVANAGVTVASGAVSAAGAIGMIDAQKVSDAKSSLKNAKSAIKDSKTIAKGDKKTRKEIFKEDKNVRNAKRSGNKASLEEARGKRDALKTKRKDDIFDRKEARYRQKHDGQASLRSQKRDARNERNAARTKRKDDRLQARLDKKEKKLNNRKQKRDVRHQRRRDSYLGRKWEQVSSSALGVMMARFGNGFKKFTGAVGGVAGKIAKAPFALYNKIFDIFANIKKVLIKYLGMAGLGFLVVYVVLCLVMIVVGAIASFFTFAFADDTNYGQLLVADMKEIKESFMDMAKKDGVSYYKDAIDNANSSYAQSRVIYSQEYGDGTLVISEIADSAQIGNYYVSYTGYGNYKKTDNMLGSMVPYFGIMRHRYMADEIDGDLYGLAKAQMFNLWIKAHTIQTPNSYSYTIKPHTNLSECKNIYTHAETTGYGNYPKDEFGECNYFITTPSKGDLNCQHDCTYCYSYEYEWNCGYSQGEIMPDGKRHIHNYYGCGGYDKKITYHCGQNHEHTSSCPWSYNVTYNCSHTHEEWKSEEEPGCYNTNYTYTCQGHCPGVIYPVVDLYYTDSVEGLAALDIDRSLGGNYSSFHPSHRIEKDEFSAYPDNKDATKRYEKNNITETDGWKEYWADVFGEMNAGSSSGELTIEGIDKFTSADYARGFDEHYVLEKFPNSYNVLSASDLEDIKSMIGSEADGYLEGVENWEEFDVFFNEDTMGTLNKAEKEEFKNNLTAKYGINLNDTSKRSIKILNAVINNAGVITYNDDRTTSQNSLRFVNTLLIGVNGGAYPDFDFYEKKAKKTVKDLKFLMWQEVAGVANQYDHMRPGAILINPEREKLGIYLGMVDENECLIIDSNPNNPDCSIYTIGIDELDTRFTKAITASEIDEGTWITDKEKEKFPWPNN